MREQIQPQPQTDEAMAQPVAPTEQTEPQVAPIAPPVDIFENADELLVVADMPGVPPDALDLQVDHGVLALRARRPADESSDHVFEYRRSFQLPDTVDTDRIKAELREGVLRVHLGKREELKPRRIEVRSA